jgi:hypothetical protein
MVVAIKWWLAKPGECDGPAIPIVKMLQQKSTALLIVAEAMPQQIGYKATNDLIRSRLYWSIMRLGRDSRRCLPRIQAPSGMRSRSLSSVIG